jgi:UPF0716 family protein affecting phage T7 exclusion
VAIAGILCIVPGAVTDLVGVGLGAIVWAYLWSCNKKRSGKG